MTFRILILLLVSCLAGCASGGGAHWWVPATWGSASSAKATDKAAQTVGKKQDEAVHSAQLEVAKTGEALQHAPASREVELAARFNGNAYSLLAQSEGAVTAAEMQAVKKLVAELRSENVAIRATAEKSQQTSEAQQAKLSVELATATKELDGARADLRQAFDRENALANTLRTERMVKWSLVGLALIATLGWAYARWFAGGIPGALGALLHTAEKKSPALAEDIRGLLDTHLNRNEQQAVAKNYLHAR